MTERVPADPWLSAAAVERLTGCVKARAQCRKLREMGIPYRPNAIGWPLVEAAKVLTVVPVNGHRASPEWGKVKRGQTAKAQSAPAASNDDAAGRVLPIGLRRR